jgi:hypothetical protein
MFLVIGQNIVDEDKPTYLARRHYEESFKLQELHRLQAEKIPDPFDDDHLWLQKAIVDAYYLRIQALQDVSKNLQNTSDKITAKGGTNFSNPYPYNANNEALNRLAKALRTQERLKRKLNRLRNEIMDQRLIMEVQLADIKNYLNPGKQK